MRSPNPKMYTFPETNKLPNPKNCHPERGDRRERRPRTCIFFLLPLALSLAFNSASAQSPAKVHVFHHENVLGTSMELKLKTTSDAEAVKAEAAVLSEIDRENHILSAWSSTSEFSRWTRTHNTPVHVSLELFEVLSLFDHWRDQTSGALDASAETAVRT